MLDLGFFLKKTLTLTILVDPFLTAPLFVLATAQMSPAARVRFARALSVAVAVGLLCGGLLGLHVLSFMGVTLGSIQLAGGVITFGVALAMVVAKEDAIKGVDAHSGSRVQASLVPLAMPLLVGPAALAYVMATSQVEQAWDLVHIVVSPLIAALVTWVVLEVAARTGQLFSRDALELLERVAGFLLAAIAVEMMAAGLRALFPNLLA
jgi:multiple antibiotic resistance protein